MKTTELYVEYVIIGLETLLWIICSLYIIVGRKILVILDYCVQNLLPSIIIICGCYILGIITDRASDLLLTKRKMQIKAAYKIQSKTSLLVWDKVNQKDFATFTLSRIRILRSTIFNLVLLACTSGYLIWKYYKNYMFAIFVFLLLIIFSIIANFAHKELLKVYYKKTSIFEKEYVLTDDEFNGYEIVNEKVKK